MNDHTSRSESHPSRVSGHSVPRRHRRFAGVLAAALALGAGVSASAAPSDEPALVIDGDSVRAAKVEWAQFVATHYPTPAAIAAPCPTVGAEQLAAALTANELAPTERPHVVSLVREPVGAGIVSLSCGVDLTRPANPSGSIDAVVEVTILDGQADYPAYVRRVSGSAETTIDPSPLGGVEFARCRTEPSRCIASWHHDGLVVTVRLELSRNDDNAARARAVLHELVPHAIAGLLALDTGTAVGDAAGS